MSWFVRFSRFGTAHMVRSQDKNMSCSMASIVMVNFKQKKGLMFAGMAAGASLQVSGIPGASYVGATLSSAARDYAIKSEGEVYKIYEKYEGGPHDFNTTGSNPLLFPKVLAELGLGQWECVNVGDTGVTQALIDSNKAGSPVIITSVWDGGGAHSICCDDTFGFFGTTYLACCDPWDGELRITSATVGAKIRYDGGDTPISSGTFFGGNAHAYDPKVNNKGWIEAWITRKKA